MISLTNVTLVTIKLTLLSASEVHKMYGSKVIEGEHASPQEWSPGRGLRKTLILFRFRWRRNNRRSTGKKKSDKDKQLEKIVNGFKELHQQWYAHMQYQIWGEMIIAGLYSSKTEAVPLRPDQLIYCCSDLLAPIFGWTEKKLSRAELKII